MKPELKRRLLRPLTLFSRVRNKVFHDLRTPEEIINARDVLHEAFIQAQKKNLKTAEELRLKEAVLNWVLKNGTI